MPSPSGARPVVTRAARTRSRDGRPWIRAAVRRAGGWHGQRSRCACGRLRSASRGDGAPGDRRADRRRRLVAAGQVHPRPASRRSRSTRAAVRCPRHAPPPKARRASRACRSCTTAARYAAGGTPCGAGVPVRAARSAASRSAIAPPTCGSNCCIRVRYCRMASHKPSGTADRSSPENRPASQGGGGGTKAVRPTGILSRTTRVPANTSPSRRPRADTSEAMHATIPNVIRISTTPMAPRTSACRNRIGPPSSRTTRSPHASFPSERPWLSVSTAIGPPTSSEKEARDRERDLRRLVQRRRRSHQGRWSRRHRRSPPRSDPATRPAPGSAASRGAAPAPPPRPSLAHSRSPSFP